MPKARVFSSGLRDLARVKGVFRAISLATPRSARPRLKPEVYQNRSARDDALPTVSEGELRYRPSRKFPTLRQAQGKLSGKGGQKWGTRLIRDVPPHQPPLRWCA